MIDPYVQLQMMQQAGLGQYFPGLGLLSPQARSGGAAQLAAVATAYGSPLTGERMVDATPMGSAGLSGPFAPLMNIGGNMLLSPMMQQQGLLPMGNAGSYQQARRARDYQQMQAEVASGVSGMDAEGIYRSLRGAAAIAGMPMNREQRDAAKSLSESAAAMGPMAGLIHPELMDAITGEAGSVQSLAGRMMSANRYRLDPITGDMGYGADSNTDLVNSLFDKLYSQDNISRMQGLKAGDMGQLYERLSADGLAGPQGSLRNRTIDTIRSIQREGGDAEGSLTREAEAAGIGVDDVNLQALSNADLAKLRAGSSTLSDRLTEADADRISSQLQDYVKSVSAIREVFGEGGNPNAPMPQLIGALEGLTSGRMQQFDASRLNTMVRDMQALSQQSGKSIDQLVAMSRGNSDDLNSMMGTSARAFAPTSTSYGVTTGQAFQQVGGATGFGALSRTEAEAGAQSLFNRGLASEMANTLGALTRVEQAGGFAEGEAGDDMRAALQAIDQGKETYLDSSGVERRVPTRERDFRSFIDRGAVEGMNMGDFNMMLGDTFANQEALFSDVNRQRGAARQQFFEYEREVDRTAASRLVANNEIQARAPEERLGIAQDISSAALDAMFDLSAQDLSDQDTRQRVMSEAIQQRAAEKGIQYTDGEADRIAEQIYGQSNQIARSRGAESTVAMVQMQGRQVSEAQRSAEAQAEIVSGRNEAMALMGPKGGPMSRLFSALQRQGDEGGEADLTSFFGSMFGEADVDSTKLSPLMQVVSDKEARSREIQNELDGLTTGETIKALDSVELRGQVVDEATGRRENDGRSKFEVLQAEGEQVNQELEDAVRDVKDEGRRLGIVEKEGDFNAEDVARGRLAFRELDNLRDVRATQDFIRNRMDVTEEDLAEVEDSELTDSDLRVLMRQKREKDLKSIDAITQEDLALSDEGRTEAGWSAEKLDLVKKLEEKLEDEVTDRGAEEDRLELAKGLVKDERKTVDELVTEEKDKTGTDKLTVGKLEPEEQKAIVRDRAGNRDLSVTAAEIEERMDTYADELEDLDEDDPVRQILEDAQLSDEAFNDVIDEDREAGVSEIELDERTTKRKEQKSHQWKRAQQQLIAEKQMRAAKFIDDDTTLQDRDELEEQLEDADIDEDLRIKLVEGDEEEQREAWTEHMRRRTSSLDSKIEGEEPTEAELQRVSDQLLTIDEMAGEYLADSTASVATALGVQPVEDLRAARDEQRYLANEYYGGGEEGRARLFLDPGSLEFTDEQKDEITKEWGELDPAGKQVMLEELQTSSDSAIAEEYKGKSVDELDADDLVNLRRMKIVERGQKSKDAYREAWDSMSTGSTGDFKTLFDVTEKDREYAKEALAGEDISPEDQALALKTLNAELEAAGELSGPSPSGDSGSFGAEQKAAIVNALVLGEDIDTDEMTDSQQRAVENAQRVQATSMEQLTSADFEDTQELLGKDASEEEVRALKALTLAIENDDGGIDLTDDQRKDFTERLTSGEGLTDDTLSDEERVLLTAADRYQQDREVTDADQLAAEELFGDEAEISEEQIIALKQVDKAEQLSGVKLTKKQRREFVDKLANGEDIDPDSLTAEQKEVLKTVEGLRELTVLDEKALRTLERMHELETQDVEEEAAELGISPEEYVDLIRSTPGGEPVEPLTAKDHAAARELFSEEAEVTDEQSRALKTLDKVIDQSEGVEELTKEQKQAIVNQMAAGGEIDTSGLSQEQIEMLEKIEEVEAEELGISTEDTEAAQELFGDEEVTNEQTLALKTLDRAIGRTAGGEDFTADDKRAIVKQMVSGEEVDLETLTPQQQELYKNIQEVKAEEELGISEEDTKAAQELFNEDVEVTDEQSRALRTLDEAIDRSEVDADFTDAEKKAIVEQMAAGEEIDTSDLSPEQKEVLEKIEEVEAEELGISEEDTKAAQELFGGDEEAEVTNEQTIALKTLDEAIGRTEGGEDFTDAEKKAIVEQMAAGEEIDTSDLSPEQKEVLEKIEEVEAEAAEGLGISEEDTKAAQALFSEDVEVTDEQTIALKTLDEAIDRSEVDADFTDEEKKAIVEQMAAGDEIDTSNLSPKQKEVLEKIEEVKAEEELGISEEDTKAAQALFSEDVEVTDDETRAFKVLTAEGVDEFGAEPLTVEDWQATQEFMGDESSEEEVRAFKALTAEGVDEFGAEPLTVEDWQATQEFMGDESSEEEVRAFKALTAEGVDFEADQQAAVIQQIAAGEDVDTKDMTPEQKEAVETAQRERIQASDDDEYLKDVIQQIAEGEAVDTEGMTPKQIATVRQAQRERIQAGDDDEYLKDVIQQIAEGEAVDTTGMSESQIEAVEEAQRIQAGESDDEVANMQLFDGTVEEQIEQEAVTRKRIGRVDRRQREIDLIDEELNTLTISEDEKVRATTRREKAVAQQAVDQDQLDNTMRENGFEIDGPNEEEERERFHQTLNRQDEVRGLARKQEKYQEYVNELPEDMSQEDRDKAIEAYKKADKKAEENRIKQEELSLGTSKDILADAVGYGDPEEDAEKRKELDFGNNEANQRMLAENYKALQDVTVEGLKGTDGEDPTELQKLDYFTDEYKNVRGDDDKVRKLAEEADMSKDDFELMMEESSFMNLANEDTASMTAEEQAKLQEKRLSLIDDTDVKEQTADKMDKQQKMELFGTLKIEGDVNGKATAKDLWSFLGL